MVQKRMLTTNSIYCGDNIELLRQIDNNCIDCVVYSPAYWALRSYINPNHHNKKYELGQEPTFKEYLDKLININKEIKRVLKDAGTLYIVIADTFYGGGKGAGGLGDTSRKQVTNTGSYFNISGQAFNNKELPKKCLCNIPSRFSSRMIDELGFILRNEIIWHIPNRMPHPSHGRFVVDFEKIFFFVKSQKYYFNQLIEPFSKYSKPDEIYTGNATKDYDSQLAQNPSDSKRRILESMKKRGGRLKRCVWSINNKPSRTSHTATFPKELIQNIISSSCPENGIVLDPFCGSGISCLVAKELNRNYIGIDLNDEFCKISRERLNESTRDI